MKVKIPQYAKNVAKRNLSLRASLPKYKKFGLTRLEAKRKSVGSGVEMARMLIRNKYISLVDAKRVISFYNRFRDFKTPKSEGAIGLWGGRKFAIYLNSIIKRI